MATRQRKKGVESEPPELIKLDDAKLYASFLMFREQMVKAEQEMQQAAIIYAEYKRARDACAQKLNANQELIQQLFKQIPK